MNTTRKTKAQRGYELLCETAGKLDIFYDHELLKIARAAHPDIKDYSTRLVIYDDMVWLDDPNLEGNLHTLSSDYSHYEFRMAKALVFFREQFRPENTARMNHDVRLVFEFKVPIADGGDLTVMLDMETGRVWHPRSVEQQRAKFCSPERQEKLGSLEAEITVNCFMALQELLNEIEYSTFWQIGETDFSAERDTDVLELRRRKGRSNKTELVQILGVRYAPAGSALPQDQQENFRREYLAKQEAMVA